VTEPRHQFDETSVTWASEVTRWRLSTLSGAGIQGRVLDTGFDSNHQDFRGRSITRKLFCDQSSENDTQGHGTHCIGTACGPQRPTSGPRYGIAYGAAIYAGKVLGVTTGWHRPFGHCRDGLGARSRLPDHFHVAGLGHPGW